jgi:mono/diheme cytochrome c family protein
MRLSPALYGSAALALTLAFAVASTGAPAKHHAKKAAKKTAASSALVKKGKELIASQHCNACHSADLKGKKGFSPSLQGSTRPMTEYNEATFVRLLTKGLDNDGKPVRPPMSNACHQKVADSKAMYAYLKTVK